MSAMELAESLCREVDDICENGMESAEQCIKLLDNLAKIPMSIQIIQKTNIGIKVNMMRKKMTDEAIAKRAKNIIKEWKSVVEQKEDSSDAPPAKKQRKENAEEPKSEKRKAVEAPYKKPEPSNRPSIVANFVSASFPPKYLENDETRLKTAQLLLSALRNGEMPQGTLDPEDLAVQIELKLHNVHGGSKNYSAAVRSRVFNLRDKKNPALRENVLTGVVRAEKFAVMTAEEMASPEIREMRDKFTKEAILEHQMSVQQGTPSDMFKCGKCGKKNCTYTQLQTRSSDEPMTTFVFCLECGNRWKFC